MDVKFNEVKLSVYILMLYLCANTVYRRIAVMKSSTVNPCGARLSCTVIVLQAANAVAQQ